MTFMPPISAPIVAPIATPGGAVVPWYLLGGVTATQCVVAYAPKGAADYATSKVNLANPGTYDATDGTSAPSWATGTGWTFTTSQYLDVALTTTTETWTMLYRFSGAAAGSTFAYMVGASSLANYSFAFGSNYFNGARYVSGGIVLVVSPNKTAGVGAVAGKTGYFNGASQGTIGAGADTANLGWSIGRVKNFGSGPAHSAQALAIYNVTLSSTQVGLISTAMAAL